MVNSKDLILANQPFVPADTAVKQIAAAVENIGAGGIIDLQVVTIWTLNEDAWAICPSGELLPYRWQ